METQTAVATADEDGTVNIHSSTQTLDGVQQAVARVLGVKANAVTVGEPSALTMPLTGQYAT